METRGVPLKEHHSRVLHSVVCCPGQSARPGGIHGLGTMLSLPLLLLPKSKRSSRCCRARRSACRPLRQPRPSSTSTSRMSFSFANAKRQDPPEGGPGRYCHGIHGLPHYCVAEPGNEDMAPKGPRFQGWFLGRGSSVGLRKDDPELKAMFNRPSPTPGPTARLVSLGKVVRLRRYAEMICPIFA